MVHETSKRKYTPRNMKVPEKRRLKSNLLRLSLHVFPGSPTHGIVHQKFQVSKRVLFLVYRLSWFFFSSFSLAVCLLFFAFDFHRCIRHLCMALPSQKDCCCYLAINCCKDESRKVFFVNMLAAFRSDFDFLSVAD